MPCCVQPAPALLPDARYCFIREHESNPRIADSSNPLGLPGCIPDVLPAEALPLRRTELWTPGRIRTFAIEGQYNDAPNASPAHVPTCTCV